MRIKSSLLLLPLAFATGFAPLAEGQASSETDPGFTAEQAKAFTSFFSNPVEIDSTVALSYLQGDIYVTDQVSATARHSSLAIKGVGEEEEVFIGDTSIVRGDNGEALQQSLSIENTVEETPVLAYDENNEYTNVDFDAEFGSPFAWVSALDAEQLSEYFTVQTTSNGYQLTPSAIALGKLSPSFTSFFPLHDGYAYDTETQAQGMNQLVITTAADGTPTNLSFTMFNRDRYGIITEKYASDLKSIDQVEGVETFEASSMTSEQIATLKTAMAEMGTFVNAGNFTQNIDIATSTGVSYLSYSNYYDLFPTEDKAYGGLMLSNNQLQDANYGATYTGIMTLFDEGSTEEEPVYSFIDFAVSPDSQNMAQLDQGYFGLDEVTPSIHRISSDFFTYDGKNNTYNFDLTDPRVANSTFPVEILLALFGYGDGESSRIPVYCSDINTYEYAFKNLAINLDENNKLESIVLTFDSNMVGENATSTLTFSNIGATDLSKEESISSAYQYVLDNADSLIESLQ